ncbi:hypothetical protein [Joostella sp. CR20]|uniref:hypothetical protein n=1 Tax=Joostella sp. CR20 TaxID=2804312 RepID=UPI00313EEF62
MDVQQTLKIPVWFWIVSVIALLWNLMGVGAFIADMSITEEALAALPEGQRELYENNPLWSKIAYGIAVIGGAVGSLLLILRKKLAKNIFIISFVAIVIQMVYNLFIVKSVEVYGPGAYIMPIMVILIGFGLIQFSGYGIKKGWLK